MATDYHFVTVWRVAGTTDEVRATLRDGTSLPRWWPSVYLSVHQVEEGGPDGLGTVLDLHTKGWLPYTLRWTLRVTEPITASGFALEATGDLEGTGRWTFEQEGPEVVIVYDWRVSHEAPSAPAQLASSACLLGQPPLGDEAGRGEPAPGVAAASGRE